MDLTVALPSGRCCTLRRVNGGSTVRDLKQVAQRLLQCRYLRLVFRGWGLAFTESQRSRVSAFLLETNGVSPKKKHAKGRSPPFA